MNGFILGITIVIFVIGVILIVKRLKLKYKKDKGKEK